MTQSSKHEDDLEGLLAGLLGLFVVIALTAAAYFLIASSAPRGLDDLNWRQEIPTISCVGGLGLFFFLYGLVGVIWGKIVIGWGTVRQARTTLTGASAFVAGCSTAIGGLLFLAAIAIYFLPALGLVIHPLAALLCGLLATALGWIGGPIVRSLGY
jgi:hypothetical protein